ncbi:patatin-like phospholipase domain-containing protein [Litoribacter populi]|uniref:patatin-like phospholipase family protein n=1 Tax=Litoribacter populi TaxID=2598460 RepID=UPI0011802FA8|nr:patatin-like phospholipase family protein [Litoribacter populi]
MAHTNKENTISLGICMAGAVSAGAYTAGVMDYLLEALDKWEERKISDPENTPKHSVNIPVIGGASAGGMTGIITGSILEKSFNPVQGLENGSILDPQPHNKLYHSWVDMLEDDMFSMMLDTSDIKHRKIYSLLNSNFIQQIADRAIQLDADHPTISRNYIADDLKLFVTLSNLQGFSYDMNFRERETERQKYLLRKHADYACFLLNKNGAPHNLKEEKTKAGYL